jgi:hypothetical protein
VNIRDAILAAADHIEANPGDYNFNEWAVPKPGCKACMLGWIGKFLGMEDGTCNNDVKRAIAGSRQWDDFYWEVHKASGGWAYQDSGAGAAKALRAYADAYHPAEVKPVRVPDWQAIAATQTVSEFAVDEMVRA